MKHTYNQEPFDSIDMLIDLINTKNKYLPHAPFVLEPFYNGTVSVSLDKLLLVIGFSNNYFISVVLDYTYDGTASPYEYIVTRKKGLNQYEIVLTTFSIEAAFQMLSGLGPRFPVEPMTFLSFLGYTLFGELLTMLENFCEPRNIEYNMSVDCSAAFNFLRCLSDISVHVGFPFKRNDCSFAITALLHKKGELELNLVVSFWFNPLTEKLYVVYANVGETNVGCREIPVEWRLGNGAIQFLPVFVRGVFGVLEELYNNPRNLF